MGFDEDLYINVVNRHFSACLCCGDGRCGRRAKRPHLNQQCGRGCKAAASTADRSYTGGLENATLFDLPPDHVKSKCINRLFLTDDFNNMKSLGMCRILATTAWSIIPVQHNNESV